MFSLDELQTFIANSANLYVRDPLDGAPRFTVYTDYFGGGDQLSNVFAEGIVDGNDLDAGRGSTSFRISIAPRGTFAFAVFDFTATPPRDIPEYGDAREVRFMAKGDTVGQEIRVRVRVNNAEIPDHKQALTTEWQEYAIALPANLTPHDFAQIHFVLDSADNEGKGTVKIDEVRVTTDGFDRLRVAQSYRRGTNHDSVQDREVYPNLASLYDNALAIKALAVGRDPQGQQIAQDIADAIIASRPDQAFYFSEMYSGRVLNSDGSPRAARTLRQSLGDNSWFGMALVDVYRVTGQRDYLDRALAISDWVEGNLRDAGPLAGYRSGTLENGMAATYRSTEENICFFQLNRLIATELAALGDNRAASFTARASHAGNFVMAMFDRPDPGVPNNLERGKFWTGTLPGVDAINMSPLPLDAQLQGILSLAKSTEYSTVIDWSRPLAWAESRLPVMDGADSGFTFSTQSVITDPNTIWYEGTAQGAVVYRDRSATPKYNAFLATLEHGAAADPLGAGQGVFAASRDDLDTGFGFDYDRRLHVGATAWTFFAREGINPFEAIVPLGTSGDDTLTLRASADSKNLEIYNGNPPAPGAAPIFAWPMSATAPLPIDTFAGNDSIFVELPMGSNGPAGGLRLDMGSGNNALHVRSGRVALASNALRTNVLTALEIAPGATLDLSNNDLIIRTTSANKAGVFNTLYSRLFSGFATGAWNGTGLTSSAAKSNPDTTLALVDNALLGYAQFSGEAVDANSLLLKHTYYGDIDQNGAVDADDLTVFANNFGRINGATQVDGDVDFNGTVDADDLTVFANNFGRGVGAPLAAGALAAVKDPPPAAAGKLWAGSGLSTRRGGQAADETAASVVISLREMEHASSRGARRLHSFGELAATSVAHSKRSFGVVGSQTEFGNQEDQEENDSLVDLLARSIADKSAGNFANLADSRLATSRRARFADALFGGELSSF